MDRTLRFRLIREGALTLALTACAGGATDPAAARLAQPARLANPVTTFNQLQSISAATNTTLWESFSVLAPHFTPAGAARFAVTRSLALATLPLELAARYSPWRRSVPLTTHHAFVVTSPKPDPSRLRRSGAATFPPTKLGKTFVWDPSTGGYAASGDSGAPANGERFLLYAISRRTGLPSVPLATIGYVDLTNQSGDSSVLGVTLVGTRAPAATYASYTVSGVDSSETLAGFATDGASRLDIRADVATTTSGALRMQAAIDVPAQSVQITESATVSGGDTAHMTTDLSLVSGGETVRATGDVAVDTASHSGAGSMAVSVNACPFATIDFGGPDLVFRAAPGVALTPSDETTLRAVFSSSFELIATVRLLLVPAGKPGA